MLQIPAAKVPRRSLWALTVAVLIGHFVLLQSMPDAFEPPDRASTRAFTTRTIVLMPPAPAAIATAAPATPPPVRQAATRALSRSRQDRALDTTQAPGLAMTEAPTAAAVESEPGSAPSDVSVAAATPQPAASAPPAPTETLVDALQPPLSPAVMGPSAAVPAEVRPAALALAIPGSVRLQYQLTGEAKNQTYHARGELLWLQDGQTYDARLEFSAFLIGSRVRTSSGKITDRGLAPTRFSDKWRRNEVAAHFEREKGIVSFSANTPSALLLGDAQDQLSVLLQLASMLAGDPARYPAASTISLPVIGPREADMWSFTVQGEEKIYLPTGETNTVKLTRNPRREFDQKVEAWMAPVLGYMPVRFRITQPNGDFVDQQLRGIDKP